MLLPQSVSTNKNLSRYPDKYEIFDDAFNFNDVTFFHSFFIKDTVYRIGWPDRYDTFNKQYMHSMFSLKDMDDIGFLKRIKNNRLLELIGGRTPVRMVVNVTSPSYVFYQHAHTNQDSLVYYANTEWPKEWAGETMIYEDNGIDILTCIPFVPGRVLWLKNQVIHALRPPSAMADVHRLTFACFFDNPQV